MFDLFNLLEFQTSRLEEMIKQAIFIMIAV